MYVVVELICLILCEAESNWCICPYFTRYISAR
jgi:hypothetical protein